MKTQKRELDPTKPVCILRTETGDIDTAEVLTEYGTENARIFANMKTAKRWIKRNVVSSVERQKLYFVQAPSVK